MLSFFDDNLGFFGGGRISPETVFPAGIPPVRSEAEARVYYEKVWHAMLQTLANVRQLPGNAGRPPADQNNCPGHRFDCEATPADCQTVYDARRLNGLATRPGQPYFTGERMDMTRRILSQIEHSIGLNEFCGPHDWYSTTRYGGRIIDHNGQTVTLSLRPMPVPWADIAEPLDTNMFAAAVARHPSGGGLSDPAPPPPPPLGDPTQNPNTQPVTVLPAPPPALPYGCQPGETPRGWRMPDGSAVAACQQPPGYVHELDPGSPTYRPPDPTPAPSPTITTTTTPPPPPYGDPTTNPVTGPITVTPSPTTGTTHTPPPYGDPTKNPVTGPITVTPTPSDDDDNLITFPPIYIAAAAAAAVVLIAFASD